ncbi:hypothetical protein KIL84_015936 [Mauremys mutica]|uniref:Uncharacterized protein n=1 Tax=Mauremys mutica TaxID=74926 RepID=A0A9D3WMW3_9SAUR|nr:hypothetical protein KIL84_015936 [Mauremys mutica]
MRPSVMTEDSEIQSQCAKVHASNHLHTTKPMAGVVAHINEAINIQSNIQRETEHLLLTKRRRCVHHSGKVERDKTQTGNKTNSRQHGTNHISSKCVGLSGQEKPSVSTRLETKQEERQAE